MYLRQVKDTDELMVWRREVIEHVFGERPDSALLQANEAYYRKHIPDGSHIAFIAEKNGKECGCGAICLTDELPSPDNSTGKCAYLMNIYVREEYRQHGIAHAIVAKLVEEAKNRGCHKIYLETTADGKGVYESSGFKDMPDMMKYDETEI